MADLPGGPPDSRIKSIRSATQAEWDDAWRGCSTASYFQSRQWAEALATALPGRYRPAPLHVTLADDQQVVLPLSLKSRDGLPLAVSSPAGTYGGWLSRSPLEAPLALALVDWMTSALGDIYWQTNPFDASLANIPLPFTSSNETHVIDLAHGWDAVHAAWSTECRRAERKAQRSGIIVKRAVSEQDWRDYYAAYEDSLNRWGNSARSRYDWTFFECLRLYESVHLQLWLASTSDGRVAAGAIMCYAGTHAVYWHGAAAESLLALRPVNQLFSTVIHQACQDGYRWFDFNPSGGLTGVQRFKEGFGAKLVSCPIVSTGS